MSIRTNESIVRFPRDGNGRRVSRICPVCDCGVLQYEGDGIWRCDGLVDHENPEKELEACTFTHENGKPIQPPTRKAIEAREKEL